MGDLTEWTKERHEEAKVQVSGSDDPQSFTVLELLLRDALVEIERLRIRTAKMEESRNMIMCAQVNLENLRGSEPFIRRATFFKVVKLQLEQALESLA
jgi:hypothetical protein